MGMEDVFEEWNAYSRKKELKERDVNLDGIISNSRLKIAAVTGIRRSGKSSLLMLLHHRLEKEGKRACYINLDDSRIKDAKNVLDSVIKWFGDEGWLLLDEVTNAHDWEGWLARNHEMLKGRLNLILSSSRKNLTMPKKTLRGRILPYEIYPLSFREFLRFKNVKCEKTTAGMGRIENALAEFLVYGGFPEVTLLDDRTDKVRLLNSYFRDIIGLDVAEISGENISTVELFGKYVIETTIFSASKCLNFFKSVGHKIGKQSLLNLETCSQAGYLFFFIPVFSYNIKDQTQYPRKSYIGDTGFLYAISGKTDMGRLFENAVLLELKRRIKESQNINYWKSPEGVETDFVIREGLKPKEIIQVVYSMDDEKTRAREIKGLTSCANELGLKEGLIITKSVDEIKSVNGIKIKFVPLWKWLLGE